jgi:HEPN domain-containing protein
MRRPLKEAHRWLLQGENDLRFAELAVREGFYAQACFICQQSGEKALKAVAYALGDRQVVGHSLFVLVEKLKGVYPDLASLSEDAGILDQYQSLQNCLHSGSWHGRPARAHGRDGRATTSATINTILGPATRTGSRTGFPSRSILNGKLARLFR